MTKTNGGFGILGQGRGRFSWRGRFDCGDYREWIFWPIR